MKIFLIATLLIITSLFTEAQTYPSSCSPTGTMQATYHNDAARLAIKRLHDTNSPLADSVVIPQLLIDSITKALYAIHNIQNVSVIDTIQQYFSYDIFPSWSDSTHMQSVSNDLNDAFGLKQINLLVNNDASWADAWMAGNYNATAKDSVNYLVNKYQLQIIKEAQQPFPSRTRYIITSPVAINAEALAKQFENISRVPAGFSTAVSANFNGNSGKVLQATFTNDAITLAYTVGCGDWGGTYGRTWTFKVNTETDCSIDYVSVLTWGSDFFWLDDPCLLYNQDTELCPSGSKTLYSNAGGNNIQWQVSTDSINFTNITDNSNYSGSNTGILNLTNVPSSWYGNIYRVLSNGITNGKITYNLKFVNRWNGTNDNWENASGWSCGSLPDANTDVFISAGNVVINADATVRSLKVAAGTTLTVATGVNFTILH